MVPICFALCLQQYLGLIHGSQHGNPPAASLIKDKAGGAQPAAACSIHPQLKPGKTAARRLQRALDALAAKSGYDLRFGLATIGCNEGWAKRGAKMVHAEAGCLDLWL